MSGGAGHQLDPRLQRLVAEGVLTEQAAREVERALELGPSASGAPVSAGRRTLLGEIAGYVGAAFVVIALVLLLATEWDTLGLPGQLGILAGATSLTWIAAAFIARAAPEPLDAPAQAGRRRLVGALASAAAVGAALVALVWFTDGFDEFVQNVDLIAASATALVLTGGGYRWAPSAVGQVVAAGSSGLLLAAVAEQTGWGEVGRLTLTGVLYLAAAAVWLVLTERGVFRERTLGHVVTVAAALAGSMTVAFSAEEGTVGRWLGYGLIALVAAAGLLGYLRQRSWPALLGGVAAATTVVPAVLFDVTDGRIGVWGVMLTAGATLLLASGLTLRTNPPASPL